MEDDASTEDVRLSLVSSVTALACENRAVPFYVLASSAGKCLLAADQDQSVPVQATVNFQVAIDDQNACATRSGSQFDASRNVFRHAIHSCGLRWQASGISSKSLIRLRAAI